MYVLRIVIRLPISKHSNHPPSILRQLPASVNKRLSTLSPDKHVFEDAAQTHQNTLGHSNLSDKLEYMPDITKQTRRNRQRNIIWFKPPLKNVITNIARSFLKVVDTHFPAGYKIFNRNTGKVSYSCMSNFESTTTSPNTRIIRKSQGKKISTDNCNCRKKIACPLQNKCGSKDIVCKSTINTTLPRLQAHF